MKKIIVASKNPVKINTTLQGFKKVFPNEEFEIEGISAKSEVADQPMSEEETLKGSLNRVNNAKKINPDADFWVGIEGGIEINGDEMKNFAWIVISDKSKIGKAQTGVFYLPKKVADLIKEGKELGEADDIVFKMENSKQANGSVGILTKDVLTRTSFYESAVILALIPFVNGDLY